VDVIAIYVPNYCRVEVMEEIAAAVKTGAKLKGVIVDKPLARNMREAGRMVELAREAKLLTAYFENQIFMKAIRSQREQLLPVAQTMGPLTLTRSAEDFATGMITYRNPETGQIVKSRFTDSWMFEKRTCTATPTRNNPRGTGFLCSRNPARQGSGAIATRGIDGS
jgi:Oxidoreductase family, NAD-binding Rossmann fold